MTGNAATQISYRGRFAPSPTGPLHFGSLVAAVASYLQAASRHGEWLVRIEDIDPPREIPGATEAILRSLDAHGFEFAQPVLQSTRLETYAAIIEQLLASDAAYSCSCSRKAIRKQARTGLTGPVYPGTCRNGSSTSSGPATSIRVRTTPAALKFTDGLQGVRTCQPETDIGDFLIRRGDGLVAYQLAVVVDDHAQHITEVVRGTDLLDTTFMQLWLQQQLGYPHPAYMHFPVVTGADNVKLSKQTGAPPINDLEAAANLFSALVFLGQNPENSLKTASIKGLWDWARANWNPTILQGTLHRDF
jgi:glutamyl-Q tRNA(Asp) synthetase